MSKDLVCKITEYMDRFRDPKQCKFDYMHTHIFIQKILNLLLELITMTKIMKNKFLDIKNIFTTIVSKILDIVSLHINTVTIRPSLSTMTITESMKQSVKLKNLKQFAEWVYKKWTHWDKEFNWDYLDTWCYDEKPDNRIGWRKTYIITISYPSHNGSYAIAFTDKPFYKLKSNLSDNEEITHKYPKLLECVTELQTGTRDESKLYQKHKINIFE